MARLRIGNSGQRPDYLPEIRFHDLRHTCLTLLLSLGNPPQMQPGAARVFPGQVVVAAAGFEPATPRL
ncbi:hypothetical protein DLJ46_10490 [Micromonospora globispora]|uniref:Tyr recombinase domain-containing protein n=1 Tax=Micromonospora globispora TaxID=1450148 RepID=A0A317KC68_9ACTN|nr:hypothetical protein DLJ46_10490 [Micromonospora globispora]